MLCDSVIMCCMDCCVCYVFVCLVNSIGIMLNLRDYVKSWKIGPGFVQEKEFVNKILENFEVKKIAVFKLLHVWSSKEAAGNEEKEKKKSVM